MDQPFDLATTIVKLGPRGTTEPLALTPSFWRNSRSTGPEDRFLGVIAFDCAAQLHEGVLERHPGGDELILVLEGALALVIEETSREHRVELREGEACVVPRGAWHRLAMLRPGRLLFLNSRHRMESRPLHGDGDTQQEDSQ